MTQSRKHRHRARRAGIPDEFNDLSDYDVSLLLAQPCAYCGAASTELDHVTPLNRTGARNTLSGTMPALVGSCRACNAAKQDKRLHEWGRNLRQTAQMTLPGMPDAPGYDWRNDHD